MSLLAQAPFGDASARPLLTRFAHSVRHVSPRLAAVLPGVVHRGTPRDEAGRRLLYLTFDDGPVRPGTPAVLDMLARRDCVATFFVLGSLAARDRGLLRAIAEGGHAVGNHGWEHLDAWRAHRSVENLERAEGWLEDALGRNVRDVRPPYGHLAPDTYRWARRGERRMVLWDVMPGDYDASRTPAELAAVVGARVVPGSIVVLHDGHRAGRAVETLELSLPRLIEEGWRFPGL